jgi:hypothetical protein
MPQPSASNFDQNIQNFNAALRNDFAPRTNAQGPLHETIKTSTSFFSNPTPQGQQQRGKTRRMVAEGKNSSLPVSS